VNTATSKGRGFPQELLLRVEYVRGGQQKLPKQVTGPAAAALEPGRVVRRKRLRYKSGRPVEIVLVSLGKRFVLDEFLRGRRTARIDVPPDFRADDGRILKFEVLAQPDEALGIFIEYARTNSARILNHYYGAFPREFEFVN
jgi:hypothetical protein